VAIEKLHIAPNVRDVFVGASGCVCMCAYVLMGTHACVYMCACLGACLCVCVCVYVFYITYYEGEASCFLDVYNITEL